MLVKLEIQALQNGLKVNVTKLKALAQIAPHSWGFLFVGYYVVKSSKFKLDSSRCSTSCTLRFIKSQQLLRSLYAI